MNALSSEITTGMSAPPIGLVSTAPSTSASTKNSTSSQALAVPAPTDEVTIQAPSPIAATPRAMFTRFCAGSRNALFMMPCSFRKAITEPLNATEPISEPSTANVATTGPCTSPRANSTAAISAAAPPPMPL